MAEIICLANSNKLNERCLAGIDIATGEWIRPVSARSHQEITWAMRQINGNEPKLLDMIDIPLQATGPDIGCQPENRLLAQGKWKLVKQLKPADISNYYESDDMILHNHDVRIPFEVFSDMPPDEWKSLQLIHNTDVTFEPDGRNDNWRAHFQDGTNIHLALPVTDPEILDRLDNDQEISNECIMTISMGGPWSRSGINQYCYKLAAGIIEL